ncbi:uncharacterized protein LOC111031189 isoform X2 [Myzus persicae]|uniref:uncharacterized protein LOC111031189 isoform X2 n=1 Tax=Myzus persicae TaxID=13164 RepID=UPI000B934817|nr:uncharacterized protein LOC111031189 isoform X2 [Myzus persicae]
MAKPIYCSLLLLVLCLTFEAYGNHHRTVRHIRHIPSYRFSNNFGPYDSSSTAAAEGKGAEADDAATSLSPPSPLRKSFSLNNSSGYEKNRGLDLKNKSSRGVYYGRQPNDMDSGDLNNDKILNSMMSRFPNNKPLSGLYNKNNPMDLTSRNLNIGKRQNSLTSNFQDIPDLTRTKINPLAKGIARQNTLPSSSNEDDSQRISFGNDNSNMMSMMNSIQKPLNNGGLNGQNIIFKSFRRCCINNECRMLKDGEECSIEDYLKNKQQPNNPMLTTSSNGDHDLSDIMSKFKLIGQSSFNGLEGNKNNFQETRKPTNMQLGSMRFSTIPSIGSSNGMGSYVSMPQKRKTINYPHSEPFDMTEDEANEIREQVLQKSNLYREKYNLDPFVLDDQLTNCAQDWANKMARDNKFDHRENNAYGENLYGSSELNNLGEKAVESWYNEILQFNIDDDEEGLSTNTPIHHMTQLLWKSSTKLGVGVSKNSANGMYNVVANYDPAGNLGSFYKENVPDIKQEDIEEAKESQAEQAEQETSWSSRSKSPLQSQWNYGPYYN